MKLNIILAAVTFAAVYAGCSKDTATTNQPLPICDSAASKFSAKVFPVIESSCATSIGCHGNGSANGPGALTNFTQIKNAAAAIKGAVISGAMPKGSSLSVQDKNAVICWINNGTPNN